MIGETLAQRKFAANDRFYREASLIGRFLDEPGDDAFTELYKLLTPQLVAFYRVHKCDAGLSEDLAQQVMLTLYCKAGQIRDRALFRPWLFRVAHNTLCHHCFRQAREVKTLYSGDLVECLGVTPAKTRPPAFEFMKWMEVLNPRERDVMMLRFIEEWQYHEIATDRDMPIGTVQWIVFNAKKKLGRRLCNRGSSSDPTK